MTSDQPRRINDDSGTQITFNGGVYGYTHTVHASGPYFGYIAQAGPGIFPSHASIYGDNRGMPEPPLSQPDRSTNDPAHSAVSRHPPTSASPPGNWQTTGPARIEQPMTRPHEGFLQNRSPFSPLTQDRFSRILLAEDNIQPMNRSMLGASLSTARRSEVYEELSLGGGALSAQTAFSPASANLSDADDRPASVISNDAPEDSVGASVETPKKHDPDSTYWQHFKHVGSLLWKTAKKLVTVEIGRQPGPCSS